MNERLLGILVDSFPKILIPGLTRTIPLTAIAFFLALVIAVAAALAQFADIKGVKQICRFYIWVIRGTPLLVQLFVVFFGLPHVGVVIEPFAAAILVISASEDIGLANPNALLLANAAFDAVMKIGWPEGRIPLAEATVYLAASPKSNSAYEGINGALELVRQTGNLPVPLHLRNAPTKLMKQLGYGKDYKYAHAYAGNFVQQQFLPDEVKDSRIWHPQDNAQEAKLKERMQHLWGERFKG